MQDHSKEVDWTIRRVIREEVLEGGEPVEEPDSKTPLKVVLSGCSGGGKSTLLEEMAARGYVVQPEPGRQIVREQLASGGDGLPWDNPLKFIDLCVERAILSHKLATSVDRPTLFDRSFLDNIAAFSRMGLPVPPHLVAVPQKYRYAKRVFLTPPWKELFVNDSERRHSFEEAVIEYEDLLNYYPANGYEVVLIPKGTVAERASFLEQQLELIS